MGRRRVSERKRESAPALSRSPVSLDEERKAGNFERAIFFFTEKKQRVLSTMLKKNALPPSPPAPQAAKKCDFLDDDESDEDEQPVILEAGAAAPKLRVNEGFAKKLEVKKQKKGEALKREQKRERLASIV